jgi:hypothetical protein
MKAVHTLALVGLSQAATGNFCQNQANYAPTAMAGHPGAAADTNACSAKMATYEIADWKHFWEGPKRAHDTLDSYLTGTGWSQFV